MSLRDKILSAQDLTTEKLKVPEWDATIYVRTMTGAERDLFEQMMVEKKSNIRASLAVLTVVDEKGERIFSNEDVDALGNKSAKPLQRIWKVSSRLNAITAEDEKELEKN